jgi:anti-anti-sigma factor
MDSPRPREDTPPLDVAVTRTPTLLRVRVGGEVDLSNAAALHATLSATELDGQAAVDLDLHRLTFCDIAGGRLLLAFLDRAQKGGNQTTIHGATSTIQRLLCLIADGQQPTFE